MITLAEQIAEVQRELALRKHVYPQLIRSNTLDAGAAAYQVAVLKAVLQTLTLLDFAQRQLPLFPVEGPQREDDACPYCGRESNGEPCAPCCGA